ncbi:hypothetical protein ACIQFZ_41435 [Streptomyces sp. NPDC093064]|uniref:hypothetical protein n=1 Tax=Streptomyces sp. NPDC093064 TaxID=3366020 RepID=UPI003823BF8B
MNPQTHLAIDGYVDAIPAPGTSWGTATFDAFRATLAALRNPEPWTPGHGQDVAVRVGPFIERAHP